MLLARPQLAMVNTAVLVVQVPEAGNRAPRWTCAPLFIGLPTEVYY